MKGGTRGLLQATAANPNADHFSRSVNRSVQLTEDGVADKYDILVPSYRRADDALDVSDWIPMQRP